MSVTGLLSALAVKVSFNTSPDQLLGWVGARFSNPGRPLQKALGTANESAWRAVGLAVASEGLFDRLAEAFPGVELSALREQHRHFLERTPAGLDSLPAAVRVRACRELDRLRKAGRLTLAVERPTMITDLWRCGDPAKFPTHAAYAVAAATEAIAPDAPHLARAIRLAPPNGIPLLGSAFMFFFRRELLAHADLARGATPDALRPLVAEIEPGLAALVERPGGPIDQFDTLFDAYAGWCSRAIESLDWLRTEVGQWQQSNRVVPVAVDAPVPPAIVSESERSWVKLFQDRLRQIPPEVVEAGDWQRLGACFDACGLFEDAFVAHAIAAAKSGGDGDPAAEGENAYRAYKDACLTGKWPEAKEFLLQAARLDPRRFRPFDTTRFTLDAMLSAGARGPRFRCLDTDDLDDRGNPLPVLIEPLHLDGVELRTALAEARALRDLHRPGSRLLRVYGWGFAHSDADDPTKKSRPFLVLEDFPGESLESPGFAPQGCKADEGGFPRSAFLPVAFQVAEALAKAHKQNVLHRGLTPGCILCRVSGDQWDVRVGGFCLYPSSAASPQDDVSAFGKVCLRLLFNTTYPTPQHWETVPTEVREPLRLLLDTATHPLPEHRYPNFTPVLAALRNLITPPKPEPVPPPVSLPPPPVPAAVVPEPEPIPVPAPAEPTPVEGPKSRGPLDPARHRTPGERFAIKLPGDVPLTFAWCPPGTFEMGSPREDAGSDEKPVHAVTLTRGFFIGIYPVTQAQWMAAQMGKDPSQFPGPDRPVEQVLWEEAQRFCRRITRQLKGRAEVRLPTEAQWEYACRAGTGTDYYTGDGEEALRLAGWYDGNSGKETHPVGELAPNEWGLHDMHGNVWEWCLDYYDTYPAAALVDPVGPETGTDRVFRGGGWGDSARFCRSTYRSWFDAAVRYDALGFRVVMVLTG